VILWGVLGLLPLAWWVALCVSVGFSDRRVSWPRCGELNPIMGEPYRCLRARGHSGQHCSDRWLRSHYPKEFG